MNPNGRDLYTIGQLSYTSVYSITNGIPAYTGDNLIGGASNWNYGVIDPYGRSLFELDSGNGSGPTRSARSMHLEPPDEWHHHVCYRQPFTTNLSSARGVIHHTGQSSCHQFRQQHDQCVPNQPDDRRSDAPPWRRYDPNRRGPRNCHLGPNGNVPLRCQQNCWLGFQLLHRNRRRSDLLGSGYGRSWCHVPNQCQGRA